MFLLAKYIRTSAPGITVKVISDWSEDIEGYETTRFLENAVGLGIGQILEAKNYVILIDEAQRTYSNLLLWGTLMKDCANLGGAKFALFSAYGSAGGCPSKVKSGTPPVLQLNQRISLHPTGDPPVGLLLTEAEAIDIVDRICNTTIANTKSTKFTEKLRDFLIRISGYHVGALASLVKAALDKVFQSQVSFCKLVHQPTI
jgi:hypothetical protein